MCFRVLWLPNHTWIYLDTSAAVNNTDRVKLEGIDVNQNTLGVEMFGVLHVGVFRHSNSGFMSRTAECSQL